MNTGTIGWFAGTAREVVVKGSTPGLWPHAECVPTLL